MSTIFYILIFGSLMSLISLIGGLTVTFKKEKLDRFMSFFIAFASGSLIGGAFFHMIPHVLEETHQISLVMILLVLGFTFMYGFELMVHWHHCNSEHEHKLKPQGMMILMADGIHNLIGGIGIGAAFVADVKLGIGMWMIALLHEIPQEIGDYAVLLDSGWEKKKALAFNFFSSLTFLLGMLLVYGLNSEIDVVYLIPFAAGNFIYIAASDLIPEVKRHPKLKVAGLHLACFLVGLAILLIPELLDMGHHHHHGHGH